MRSGGGKYYAVGDYMVGRQIGSGSFSTVWHARHRVHGIEVAIKEIITAKLNLKLQESLKSEIFILKKINHPNIIRLHDMIEVGAILIFAIIFILRIVYEEKIKSKSLVNFYLFPLVI